MIATLKELYEAGFVYWQDTVNRGEQEKSKKREKVEKVEKNKGDSGLKYQEQKTKAITFPSNGKTDLQSKIFFSSDIEKKRKVKSLQDVSMTAQHFHEGNKVSSQIGYIVGSENRFYKTEKKKSKRKKLRIN